MKTKTIIALVIVLWCCSYPGIAAGQCDSTLTPAGDKEYKYKNRGNRCEGFYKAKVSGACLDLVGVLKGKLRYNLDEKESVTITSPLVTDKSIYIMAQAIPVKTYYRMDALLEPGMKLEWEMDDVIYPKRLNASKIGIKGYYIQSGDIIYAPLSAEPSISNITNDQKIRIVFRSTIDVYIKYLWHSVQYNRSFGWQEFARKFRSGKPIIISPPASAKGLFILWVQADAVYDKSIYMDKRIRIYTGTIDGD